jgi:hypothetical protein
MTCGAQKRLLPKSLRQNVPIKAGSLTRSAPQTRLDMGVVYFRTTSPHDRRSQLESLKTFFSSRHPPSPAVTRKPAVGAKKHLTAGSADTGACKLACGPTLA